eukprot:m.257898 g.257898  ORF g.257898 m.257898 type:complete len:447 (-) comp35850_c0_seq1:45-1385(-)
MSQNRQRGGMMMYATAAAASVSSYFAFQWFQGKYASAVEKRTAQTLDQEREKLLESCKVWEVALRRAVESGDTVRANKLRQVLRRAYHTLEALDGFEPEGSTTQPRLNRELLEKLNGRTDFRRENDDGDFDDTASDISFASAISSLRDLDGTSLAISEDVSTPRRVDSRAPRLPKSPHVQRDLWQQAQLLAQRGEIKVRKMRQEYTGCSDDLDFTARLHCFRQGIAIIVRSDAKRAIMKDPFMHVLSGILIKGGADPATFKTKMDALEEFIDSGLRTDGLAAVSSELLGRGIVEINFFDIALDYLLFDALDAVKLPPATVKAALQNEWVPVSIRIRSMKAAVWSIVRTRLMMFKRNTFMFHFYDIVTVVAPPLSCGLLGIGDPAFVEVSTGFVNLVIEYYSTIFAIPGSTSGPFTPEIYAEKILKVTKQYIPRATQMVAKALETKT